MENVDFTSAVPPNGGIERILNANNKGHNAFISHLDSTPVAVKRKLFYLYSLIYSIFAAFIIWRFVNGSTRYLPMLIPGMEWAGLVDRPGRKAPTSWTWSLINIGIDSFVATTLLPAVQSFVTEQVWMRYKYGFRPVEVVFRTPTNWEAGNLKNLTADAREHKLMDSIYEAGNNKWVHSRPGDSTWTSIWRIECKPTGAVYNALASGNADFSLDDWKLAVWRKYNGGWISWELWKINDAVGRDEYTRVFEKLKENLVQRGKGDVVDRLIQIFINRPGEATLTREQEIQKLFESEGLDFAQIWNEARAAATQIPTPAPS